AHPAQDGFGKSCRTHNRYLTATTRLREFPDRSVFSSERTGRLLPPRSVSTTALVPPSEIPQTPPQPRPAFRMNALPARLLATGLWIATLLSGSVATAAQPTLAATPFDASGIYKTGQKAGWTLTLSSAE